MASSQRGSARIKSKKAKGAMPPNPHSTPGSEVDSTGIAIPMAKRLPEDRQKARRVAAKKRKK